MMLQGSILQEQEYLQSEIPNIQPEPEFGCQKQTGRNYDGNLFITAPFCSLTHFAPYHYYSGFNKYWYKKHLVNNGFDIIELSANGNFFEYLAQEINRAPRVSKIYANSRPNFLENICIIILLRMLMKFSKRDNSSSELLCFGYQVRAKKL